MHRVDPVDALYDGPHFFWRDQAHLDMDSPDYQHAILSLNLTSNLSCVMKSRSVIPHGHLRLDHGSYISVLEDDALALLCLSEHNIHHCPG